MTVQVDARSDWRPSGAPGAEPERSWRSTLDDSHETVLYGELVRRAVLTLDARHVLDVGCGNGLPTIAAAHAGAGRVIGIDLDLGNVARARANISRCGLAGRVTAHVARWSDVADGRFGVTGVDLVVSNPPYVPAGQGSAVDGGPRGTTILDTLIDDLPRSVRGLALLFGSVSDPLQVIARLIARGFAIEEMLLQPVAFGRYTSVPSTLAALRRLRETRHAWFCNVASAGNRAPHAYLTMGVVAHRGDFAAAAASAWTRTTAALLDVYQQTGRVRLDGATRVSLFPRTTGALHSARATARVVDPRDGSLHRISRRAPLS